MLDLVRIFCIYCRGELSSDHEVLQQYHSTCKNEFKIGSFDFDNFDPITVDTFRNKIAQGKRISIVETIGIIFLMFSAIYLLTLNFILSILFFLLFIILLFRIGYKWGKMDNLIQFCDIIKEIDPQYIQLSKNNCLALKGEVYIINNPKLIELFRGIYIIKFLNSETIDSNKNKYPEAPFITAFNKKIDSIQLATKVKKCQIRYNSNHAQKGLASIYYIRYRDLQFDASHLNQIITSMYN